LFYSSFVYTCVCVFLHIQCPLRECRWIQSGASGLPYYCAPLVCVSDVIELLAMCRHNEPKTKDWLGTGMNWTGSQALPYYCTSICVRSCCNWRASCVDSKPKKKKGRFWSNSLRRLLPVGPRQRSRTVSWVLRNQSDASRGHLLWPNVMTALTLLVPTSFINVIHF